MTGLTHLEAGSREDYLRFAGRMLSAGADAMYCSGSFETVAFLAREHIPVVGHVGLVPARATWTGGYVAVGKSSDAAMELYRQVKAYEEAGAIAVEIEVVPHAVASEIAARTSLLLWSMGAGGGCDAQYLFACDVLGTNRGHFPRHAKKYRDLAAMEDAIQAERVAAFREFAADVASGGFPDPSRTLEMPAAELTAFRKALDG
jgi:3-methyl-2-oxobutanoate hydroxymethyltransferase